MLFYYLYNIFFYLLYPVFFILSFFFPAWNEFRKKKNKALQDWQKAPSASKKTVALFHVASVGELEQVRPIIESLEKNSISICLSYFSASVPTVIKNFSFLHYANYIPWDRPKDMEIFLSTFPIKALVLSQYELWPNLIFSAKKKNIPIILLNLGMAPTSLYSQWTQRIRHFLYEKIDAFIYLDEISKESWKKLIKKKVVQIALGNPRVDRVLERRKNEKPREISLVQNLWMKKKETTIVAGSTWEKDEELVLAAIKEARKKKAWRLILVPHEGTKKSMERIENRCKEYGLSCTRFSALEKENMLQKTVVLLIDAKGFLAELYSLARIAHVGGGFSKSIHSIIEPACYQLPLSFGPRHKRFPEAIYLREKAAAFSPQSFKEGKSLAICWNSKFSGEKERKKLEEILKNFLEGHIFAGMRIANFLKERYLN